MCLSDCKAFRPQGSFGGFLPIDTKICECNGRWTTTDGVVSGWFLLPNFGKVILVGQVRACHHGVQLSYDCTTGLFQNVWQTCLHGSCFPPLRGHLSNVLVWDTFICQVSYFFPSPRGKHVVEPLRASRMFILNEIVHETCYQPNGFPKRLH